jgi:outer membrane protein
VADEGVILAQSRVSVALASLRAVLSIPPDAEVNVVERFEGIALPKTLAEVFDEALAQRPEIGELHAQIEQAESAQRFAHNQGRPTLGLFGRADLARSTAMPRTGALSGGVGIRWPLFDGDKSEADEDRAVAQIDQLTAALEGLRDQICVEATEAFCGLESADPRVNATERGLEAAEQGFQLAAVGYANQVVPLTDMLDAQAQRAKAGNDRVAAVYDRRMAMAKVIYALGR